jgi:hypothetical protein
MKIKPVVIARTTSFVILAAILLNVATGCDAARPLRKNELKLLVTATNTEAAIRSLKLDQYNAQKGIVCFFDTSDTALATQHLILRTRQKGDGTGDSTVKLRAAEGATELSDAERAIQPEQDWTSDNGPTVSRSSERDGLSRGLVAKVAAGQVRVAELFNAAQRKLVTARMRNFKWENLRRYGPVETLVWHQQRQFQGFPEKVTVELWHLQKDGRRQDVLEVSANVKTETDEQAQALARQFFSAAKAAGLGEPTGQTKTRMVLDFFTPGQ